LGLERKLSASVPQPIRVVSVRLDDNETRVFLDRDDLVAWLTSSIDHCEACHTVVNELIGKVSKMGETGG